MLVLSDVECDARSSHYFSFFFSFVSKRFTEFFSSYRWARHATSMTCWMMLKRAIVEAERAKNRCENSECWCESAITSKQLKILLRILLTNLHAFDLQTSCCSAISHFFNILLSLHSSIKSSNNLWRCFWHDSVLHAS